jgi:hypothetical protein
MWAASPSGCIRSYPGASSSEFLERATWSITSHPIKLWRPSTVWLSLLPERQRLRDRDRIAGARLPARLLCPFARGGAMPQSALPQLIMLFCYNWLVN